MNTVRTCRTFTEILRRNKHYTEKNSRKLYGDKIPTVTQWVEIRPRCEGLRWTLTSLNPQPIPQPDEFAFLWLTILWRISVPT